MKRTLTLAAAALVLLPAVAVGGGAGAQAAAPATDAPQVFMTNFEDNHTTSLWKAGGDATDSQTLDRATGDDGCAADSVTGGYGALRSYNPDTTRKAPEAGSDRPDPVATWAEAGFAVAAGGPADVKVTWSARSVKNCENCVPAAYVGVTPARAGGDFTFVGELGGGWQQFQYEAQVDLLGSDRLFVALGWMGGDATTGLDCIAVSVTKARTAPEDGAAGEPAREPATAAPPEGNYYYNFEHGLAPWDFRTDGTYGLLQQQYGQNGCPDMFGRAFASISNMAGPTSYDPLDQEMSMIPIPGEPALYMIASFPAARAEVSHVELDWMSKSIDQCDGCMQLAYVGDNSNPKAGHFNLLAGGLGSEWEASHFEIDLKAEPASRIYVALGWQGPSEEEIGQPSNVGFDCVSVRIHQPDN